MATIPKGCTVMNTFTVPFTADSLASLYITYSQRGKVVLEKTLTDISITSGVLTVYLTQKDTLEFMSEFKIEIQIRARYKTGSVTKSNIIVTDTDRILKDGVI